MAIQKRELFGQTAVPVNPRLTPTQFGLKTVAFDIGSTLMVKGLAVARSTATGNWVPFAAPSDSAIHVLTANATPATAGTMTFLVDGLSIETAFDTTAVAAAAAINAVLSDAGKPYTVTGVDTVATDLGDANHVATFTFSENAGAPSWDVDVGDLTGNPPVLSTTDAGTELNGTNVIRAFLWDESIQLDGSEQVLGVVMLDGEAYRDDVNTADLRALMGGAPSEAEVDIALASGDPTLRELGISIQGLDTVS